MNLSKLFETQRKLDERIIKEKGLQGQDLLDKKILALQVELGELAQNWRGFKFWSKDQEPRIKDYKQIKCKWCNGSGDDGTGVCPDCKSSGDVYKKYNPLLEEYVDCLHFILSIGLEIGVTPSHVKDIQKNTVTDQFNELYYSCADLLYCHDKSFGVASQYYYLFEHFIGLGRLLGFTRKEIEQAYVRKNQINHQRQAEGY